MDSASVLERVFESAPLALAVLDRDLRYLRVNESLARMNGRPADEHAGRSLWEVVPGSAGEIEEVCREVLRTGQPATKIEQSGPAIGLGRELRHWLADYYPLRDAARDVVGICAIVVDVTGARRADEEMRERLEFRHFLAEVSALFINLPAQDIDREIENALARVVAFLGLDRSSIGLFTPEGALALRTHHHNISGFRPVPAVLLKEQLPWYLQQIRDGHMLVFNRVPDDLPAGAAEERAFVVHDGIKSHVAVPMRIGTEVIGGIGFALHREYRQWNEHVLECFRLLADIFANALERKRNAEAMAAAMADIKQLKDRLQAENVYLREEVDLQWTSDDIIGESAALKKVMRQVEQVARTGATVLITGETGTGKELVARAIHAHSDRRDRAMIKVNCAALPTTLVEAELFGRERGAYTGALTRQLGRFESADGSSILLDEVGELPAEVQVKLLRVLQEGQFERLGSSKTISADVRVIAATNRDLRQLVANGRFREDLFYRLNVFPMHVPSLRSRADDIPRLVWAFVQEFAETMGKAIDSIPRATMETLQAYHWPGNIRELRNVIERAMILCRGGTLQIELPEQPQSASPQPSTLDGIQRRHIEEVLQQTGWRIRGQGGAAEILGVKPTTLEARMSKLRIVRS
jgi:formate hydrogenlyase transcriptional activator